MLISKKKKQMIKKKQIPPEVSSDDSLNKHRESMMNPLKQKNRADRPGESERNTGS